MIKVRFTSLTGKKLSLYTLFDPALSNGAPEPPPARTPDDARRRLGLGARGDVLVTQDPKAGSALAASPGLQSHLERLPRHERRLDGPQLRLPHGLDLHVGTERQRRPDG